MQYRVGSLGRVIVAKAETGDDLLKAIRNLLQEEKIRSALLLMIGALEQASLVVGPVDCTVPPEPVWRNFGDGREIIGLGTAFSGPEGPMVHIHASLGRGDEVLTGCIRRDSKVYLVVEIVILELSGIDAVRELDTGSMLHLLKFI